MQQRPTAAPEQELEHDVAHDSPRVAPDPADAPLARIEPIPAAAGAVNPMQMLAAGLARGISTEQLGQLMNLAERWEANEARKAYVAAMAAFKRLPIEIRRNKTVSHPFKDREGNEKGIKTYSHATLDHLCAQVTQSLAKNGLAHSWRPRTEGGKVYVTTRITHRLGHFEEITLDGEPDPSGGKNKIQAIGSTIFYLERYGLFALLGMAPKDGGPPAMRDDDGAGGAPYHQEPDAPRMRPAPTSQGHEPLGTSARTEPGDRKLYAGEAPKRIIRKELTARGVDEAKLCQHMNVATLDALPMKDVNLALDWIRTQ